MNWIMGAGCFTYGLSTFAAQHNTTLVHGKLTAGTALTINAFAQLVKELIG